MLQHQQSIVRTRQHTCAHPAEEIVHLSDGLVICNHCYSLWMSIVKCSLLPERDAQLSPVSGYGQTDVRPDEPTSYRTPVCGWWCLARLDERAQPRGRACCGRGSGSSALIP